MIGTSSQTAAPTAQPSSAQIVIIGGGLSGLSAAYELQRAGAADGRHLSVTLVERDTRLGGKIATDRIEHGGAFVVERGPDSFVTQKPWALELIRELGLEDRLIAANDLPRKTFVLVNGRPTPLPSGLSLLVPTKIGPFLRSPLFSPAGKLRMLLEPLIPARRDGADETIAAFVTRRLGREALDRLGEPLLGGIHSCEVERQSMLATFPRFVAMERQHGSLIRASRRRTKAETKDEGRRTKGEGQTASPARSTADPALVVRPSSLVSSPFVTLRGGMAELVEALVPRLEARLLTGRGALRLERAGGAGYRVHLDGGEVLEADAVILTTPAYGAAELVAPIAPGLAEGLRAIRYVSTGIATLAFRRDEVGAPIEGFGLVIPRSEGRRINACTLTSVKFDGRAPEQALLVRVFFGGSDTPEAMRLDDEALLELVRDELRATLGISAAPLWTRIYRWWNSNPQYDLGHLDLVDRLDALCPPGLLLAGSAYRGVGIPDCIRQGRLAAARAAALVGARR